MRAGADMQKINPKLFTHLAGAESGEFRPCESIMDDLYAKAVVVEGGGVTYAMISLDVTIITKKYCDLIRGEVSRALSIPADAVLVFCTQTHSAPGVGCFMYEECMNIELTPETEFLSGTTEEYSRFASESAVRAALNAAKDMRRVYVGAGRSFADGLAFNRRMIMRDGSMIMPEFWQGELGPVNALCYEGPADPEVCVVSLVDEDMRAVAMLMHFTCHPVNVFSRARSWHAVSSDWCGVWSDNIRAQYPGCVPMVLNGACGNINPWNPLDPHYKPDHRRMGRALTDVTRRIVNCLRLTDTDEISYETKKVPLEYRDIPKERVEYVRNAMQITQPQLLEGAYKKVGRDWYLALSTMSAIRLREIDPLFMYEIHALRLGNISIVGLPGEPFVEGQLEIKKRSAADFVMVAHCASQYVGYLPHEAAYACNAHETTLLYTNWAKLKPGSLEIVVQNAKEMVAGLFGGY